MILGAHVDHEEVARAEAILPLIGNPIPSDPVTNVHGGRFRADSTGFNWEKREIIN